MRNHNEEGGVWHIRAAWTHPSSFRGSRKTMDVKSSRWPATSARMMNFTESKRRRLKTGASKVFVEDLRHEFVTEYLWPLVKSGAVYEGKYLLGTSIAPPFAGEASGGDCSSRKAPTPLPTAAPAKATIRSVSSSTYKAFAPQLKIIAPWREWDIQSRHDAIAYAKARNIPITATAEKIYSRDSNIWHMSHEGGVLEDPAAAASERSLHADAGSALLPGRRKRNHHRFRTRRAGGFEWIFDPAGPACSRISTKSPEPMASAASISSRTVLSA